MSEPNRKTSVSWICLVAVMAFVSVGILLRSFAVRHERTARMAADIEHSKKPTTSARGSMAQTAPSADLERLQGEWVIDQERHGTSDTSKYVFGSQRMALLVFDATVAEYIFTIDPTQNPKHIDMKFTISGRKAHPAEKAMLSLAGAQKGIYDLRGDRLTLCLPVDAGPRPMSFSVPNDRQLQVIWLKRPQ